MKKIIMIVTMMLMYVLAASSVHAVSQGVSICINAVPLVSQKEAYIENGRTMVPARSIFEKLGAVVEWNGENGTVTATKDGTKIRLTIGSRALNVNGTLSSMDTEPVIIDGTTFVPARAVSQAFGANVRWIEELRTVNITTDGISTLGKYPTVLVPKLSGADVSVVSESESSIIYDVTVQENSDAAISPYITELVKDYEDTMTEAGWSISVPDNAAALFETDLYNDPLGRCSCEVKFFVNKIAPGRYIVGVAVTEHITVYNILTGETERISESVYLTEPKYRDTSVWKRSVGKTVTMYDNNNNAVTVYDYEMHGYLIRGYTEREKTTIMYSPDGKREYVAVQLVSEYRAMGYTLSDTVLMYSPNGIAEYIESSHMPQMISEGWSTEPFRIVLYDHNGGTVTAYLHEKDSYLAEGWYEELLIPMYHTNGAKMYVKPCDVTVYLAMGWSEQIMQNDGQAEAEVTDDHATVYITPTGKRYHISQKCAGSGAIRKTYIEVRDVYGPCGKCAVK